MKMNTRVVGSLSASCTEMKALLQAPILQKAVDVSKLHFNVLDVNSNVLYFIPLSRLSNFTPANTGATGVLTCTVLTSNNSDRLTV